MKELPNPTFAWSPVSLPKGLFKSKKPEIAIANDSPATSLERGSLEVSWARHNDEVRQAQLLRFKLDSAKFSPRFSRFL